MNGDMEAGTYKYRNWTLTDRLSMISVLAGT